VQGGDIVLGAVAFSLSLAALMIVLTIDRAGGRVHESHIREAWSSLHTSPKAHVIAYIGCLLCIAISANVLIQESESVFLIEAFSLSTQTLIVLGMFGVVLLFNVTRFRWSKTADYDILALNRALEETVDRAPSPIEGIDHVVSYVESHKKEWEPGTVESFLEYLAMRNDEAGAEARRRLEQIRTKQDPT
jgi:hypothetical protein